MSKLYKIIILIITLLLINFKVHGYEKSLFKIEDDIYTTLDLNSRIKYLDIISVNKKSYKETYDDYLSVLLFHHYSREIGLNISKEILSEYENKLNKEISDDKEFKKNLIYDLQRKTILSEELNNIKFEFNVNESFLNIYNYEIKIFSINSIKKEEIDKIIDFNNIEKTSEILSKNKFSFQQYNKEIIDIKNLDSRIIKSINQNIDEFIIQENNYVVAGKIFYEFKEFIGVKLSFLKIKANKIFKISELDCKNLDKEKNIEKYDIDKIENINLEKINNSIKENIKKINNWIKINEDYFILCDISYDKNKLKDTMYQNEITKNVNKIEDEFIKIKLKEYNFVKYD